MILNLLTSKWLEVKRLDGSKEIIAIKEINNDWENNPIISLNFPRPDWNAAVLEFIIGVFFLSMAPKNTEDWGIAFENPPNSDEIEAKLAPFAQYFDFDGEGTCAFQDFDDLSNAEIKPLSGLLIDAVGENAIRNNSDLFIKRNETFYLCLEYAAAALITLQTYAPAGGAGHRTSMRGGGPLTTLIKPIRLSKNYCIIWDAIWANVPEKPEEDKLVFEKALPWLASTIVSPNGEKVIEEGNPKALSFFATPRRIRMEFSEEVKCSVSGKQGKSAIGFKTQNYGANYLHWIHPLSPYREDKKEGLLPLHPNAGQSDYGDWLAWWGAKGVAALVIREWQKRKDKIRRKLFHPEQIIALGYDLDNAKARQWIEVEIPFLPLYGTNSQAKNLVAEVTKLVGSTDETSRKLLYYAKIAIYGLKTDAGYKNPDNLPMDTFKEIGDSLWNKTEAQFRSIIDEAQELILNDMETTELRIKWRDFLKKSAGDIFEDSIDIDGLCVENPHRVLWARKHLSDEFNNSKKASVTKVLQLI